MIVPSLLGPAEGDLLHVMTYNLRYPADDPDHRWAQRRPAMAELLNLERPTVIGTQEGHFGQLRDIAADLPAEYEWIGLGRQGGSRDEHTAVFYDAARLDPLEYSHLWLSDTPSAMGSATWGNPVPRMATWVRFADRRTVTELIVVNTHLDNRSEQARLRGAELLNKAVESFGTTPTVVTGDFNAAAETSAVYAVLTVDGALSDTWLTAERQLTPHYGTYAGYREPVVDGDRIDWLLTTPGIVTDAVAINPSRFGGRFPSDHLPVQAHLRLPSRGAGVTG